MQLGVLFFVFTVLFAPKLSLQAHAGLQGEFCVQTFNVYATAYASDVSGRLSRLARKLIADPCDAMQFQEFWRLRDFDRFAVKMKPTQQAFLHGDSFRNDQSNSGLASAFSGSVLQAHSELFRVNNDDGVLDWFREQLGVQKGFTAFLTRLDNAPEILFVNLHTHQGDPAIRLAQITQLVDYLLFRAPQGNELPLVLTGDLNAKPDSLEVSLLENVLRFQDAYLQAHQEYGKACTYCHDNPLSWSNQDAMIDYNLVRSAHDLSLQVTDSTINLQGSPSEPLSDHYGLRSQLHWEVRVPEYYLADAPEVQARREQAYLSLQRAKEWLRADGRPVFRDTIALLHKMTRRFAADSDLPEAIEKLYRLK